ncbi:hypothetical protein ACFPJA_13955 [Halorubrum glutamatedens]|uniref:Uncharacterized protein n=1 Tax=Halorubrum glutamatedens TaxID=2707018 RepID=A0ABD5QUQ5_9EURY
MSDPGERPPWLFRRWQKRAGAADKGHERSTATDDDHDRDTATTTCGDPVPRSVPFQWMPRETGV